MNNPEQNPSPDLTQVQEVMASAIGPKGIDSLLEVLAGALPGQTFEPVLTREGWHRLGGVVDSEYKSVASSLGQWVEQESDGEVDNLLERFGDAGYFATRLQGRTHYLVSPTGPGAADFLQLEVEELQEVVDRRLIDPDWQPDDLEEFIDPLDYPRLEPEPVGSPRFEFRRIVSVGHMIGEVVKDSRRGRALQRFMADWDKSSAGAHPACCRHWVLGLTEIMGSDGDMRRSAKMVATGRDKLQPVPAAQGADLAREIQHFDRAAGYPFAWYFHLLGSPLVHSEIGERVLADHANGFEYLPLRDLELLRAWGAKPYAV